MKAPLSWLKDYVAIRLPTKELGLKLTTLGLGCEKIIKDGDDEILELEITPNRPDWLSILGIAKEIAALEGKKVTVPSFTIPKANNHLPIDIKLIYEVSPRTTLIVIQNVKTQPSPDYLQDRLKKIGLRPINNLVDISNYVMFEFGNPIHIFDYDKIEGHKMEMILSKGGEDLITLDDLEYKLPKETILFKDANKIIDLCGIKGGKNSAVDKNTKNILILVAIYDGVHVRRTSKALGLRSDASAIFERGANAGGTTQTLERVVQLVLENAGGEIASDIIDLKEKNFLPWTINLRLDFTEKLLGIKIPTPKIIEIFESLGLEVSKKDKDALKVTVPTVRGDLKLEEDLIEEIARLYDYNNFPKTMPEGKVPTQKIPYSEDYKLENFIKNYLVGCGFSEINSYSLIAESEINNINNLDEAIKILNPVSLDFEYLRPSIIPCLLKAVKENQADRSKISLFESGKNYGLINRNFEEENKVTGIVNRDDFLFIKGVIEELLKRLHIKAEFVYSKSSIMEDSKSATIVSGNIKLGRIGVIKKIVGDYYQLKNPTTIFSLYTKALKDLGTIVIPYKKVSLYPPIVEDLSVISPGKTAIIINLIKNQSSLIEKVEMLDRYKDSRTFRITYQSYQKSLTDIEISKIRLEIINRLESDPKIKVRRNSN